MIKKDYEFQCECEFIPVSDYVDLNENDLSLEERAVIQEFRKLMIEMELDDCYHLGNYAEQRICLYKKDELWEVYVAERGLAHGKVVFDNCIQACINVIGNAAFTEEEYKMGKETLRRRLCRSENR